ncbi:hypothetical protein WKR88_24660 [Trinickia caryophylli]|uniref:Uncharacterized protein n=1 Tax=Trinickia caryophylli TaxID=28094 RepID=A0A1X7FNJ6_TRICW|nr:hypothetical protein [Trinickia caryophylli]PMS13884.1 hypothetical protein C0Z17_03240 [Trinickia caryophylli]TRX14381.1 hypothetical protein FNF07_24200 [Trinickia caryophylli]WQE14218.1 hypothetical protein U0034_26395 [Trinickia caryophylli]SMF55692.1 hypothetical protein SAMN06295900_11079 [Trinickia caryophylli]GLU33275.1 hypothetical protein Busp01_31170 [Trinickia caryophylli]
MTMNPATRRGERGDVASCALPAQVPAPALTLPIGKVRALSIEHHTALAILRAGRGSADAAACLLRTVSLAYLIEKLERARARPRPYRKAEILLERCVVEAEHSGKWCLPEEYVPPVAQILAVHDAQLARVPPPVYAEAWERFARVVAGNHGSPIPGR